MLCAVFLSKYWIPAEWGAEHLSLEKPGPMFGKHKNMLLFWIIADYSDIAMSPISLRKSRIFIANEQSCESSLPWPKVRKHKNIINTDCVPCHFFGNTISPFFSAPRVCFCCTDRRVRFPPDLSQSFGDLRHGHTAWQVKGNNPFGDQQGTVHKQG